MDEINNMTISQMHHFYHAIGDMRKSEMRETVIAALAGARYDNQALDNLFKQLE